MKRHNFKELKVWQASMTLVKEVYESSRAFPREELFGLTQQIRRCAISIPSNIAEGCGRSTNAQLAHFLDIAQGSAFELECQLKIAKMLDYLNQNAWENTQNQLSEIQKMIDGFKARFA